MQLELTNIINVSVAQSQAGIGAYNTSNMAIFSDETPADSFGAFGYNIYLSPKQIGVDFGTSSKTFAMGNAAFSQQPNMLTGGGYLVVILLTTAVQTLTPSAPPSSGAVELVFHQGTTAAINFGDTADMIQAKIQAVPGLGAVIATGTLATLITVHFNGVYGAQTAITTTANTLGVTFTIATTTVGETWGAAISRTQDLVQYFGCMVNQTLAEIGQTDLLAAAAILQPLNKLGFAVSHTQADIQAGGMIDLLRTGDLTHTRGLYYGDSTALNDIVMMASYAARALSTNFNGSNTTQTMQLKPLPGVQPDPTITQTIQNLATAAGADTYVSLQGVSAILCSGANSYYDQVYNLQWFVGALQVAGFNYLASASTKIPQTEAGMDGLKGAYRAVCEQAVTNQYSAPGQWNSGTTFGNQQDFLQNIAQRGYYIYSTPIAQQSQTARAARQAPIIQIALKEAGAIQSSTVIVNINA